MAIRAGTTPAITDITLIAGQSLALEFDERAAWRSFSMTMKSEGGAGYEYPAKRVVAFGGSSILKKFNRTDVSNWHWYDEDTTSNGPLLSGTSGDLVDIVSAMAVKPNRMVWIQGAQDADQITTTADKNLFKDGLKNVVAQARIAAGSSIPLILAVQGRRITTSPYPGWELIRQAHLELQSEITDCYLADRYHVELRDSVHPTHDGYREMGFAIARAALDADGISVKTGPVIASATASGNDVTVALTIESGMTVTKPASPAGFTFLNGVTPVVPTSVAWSGNDIVFTFAASPAGYTAHYLYEEERDLDVANLVRYDAVSLPSGLTGISGLPLRSMKPITI